MKKTKKFAAFVLVLAMIFTFVPAQQALAGTVDGRYNQSEARKVWGMINDFRTTPGVWCWNSDNTSKKTFSGLSELKYDARLEKAAMIRAVELSESFSHTRPNGTRCFSVYEENGINSSAAGENIAYGFDSAYNVNKAWREDDQYYEGQGHRRNMLGSKFNAVGVACAVINGVEYWVEEFGCLDTIQSPGAANNSGFSVDKSSLTKKYTGLVQTNTGKWIYVKDDDVNETYTGLCAYNGSWFYIKNGVLDWNYTGLCRYGNAWYYIANGKLNWYAKGLCKYNGNWFYVEGGKVNFGYTGLAYNAGNWFYINNGVLNWNYTGLCSYNGSWFYVNRGIVDWSYTGLCRYGNAWYYIANGKLNWYAKGLCKYNGNWFYVEGGKVNFGYTGLAYNAGNWFYINNGVLNWNYTGKCPYNGRNYNVKKGIVVF